MAILAAAADPHSWAKLMGINETDANWTTGATSEEYQLFNKPYKVPTVSLVGKNEVFIKMFCQRGNRWSATIGVNGRTADHNAAFCIKNTDGYPIIGFGYDTNASNYILDNSFMGITLYDGTANKVKLQRVQGTAHFPKITGSNNLGTVEALLTLHVKIDTVTPANSFIRMYIGSKLEATITGTTVHQAVNLALGSFTIGEYITYASDINYYKAQCNYMVVSDVPDFSLKAYPIKPAALSTPNDFSGVIGNITSWIQDTLYISTSLETNAVCTFTLLNPASAILPVASKLKNNVHTVEKIDTYMMARYIQTGGVGCTFSIALYNGETKLTDDYSLYFPANQDETKYLTKFVGTTLQNIVTMNKYTIAELANINVRVTLVGV